MQLYQSLHDRLKNQHEAIENIVSGLDETTLTLRQEPDKWSIHDNITHLAKYQPIFVGRINAILHVIDPVFNAYRAEYDPEFETWREWSTTKLLEALKSDRQQMYKLVTELTESELDRVGIHKKWGKLNIVQWTEFFTLHEAHHIYTIFQLAHNTPVK